MVGGTPMPCFNHGCLDKREPLLSLSTQPIGLWDGRCCRCYVVTLSQAGFGVGDGIVKNADVLLDLRQTDPQLRTRWEAAMIGPGAFQGLDGKGEIQMMTDSLEPFRRIGRLTVNGDVVTEVRPFLHDLGSKQAPSGPCPTGL